jgi:glycosyltransferase involved in cell wall biosynthesis
LVEHAQREQILRSIQQLHHVVAMGTPLWTYSEFNRRTLIDWGASEAQIDWVTFPMNLPPRRQSVPDGDTVNVLTVGRLVPAKGVHVLLDALAMMPCELLERIRVRVVSATTFSSEEYRDQLDAQLQESDPQVGMSVEFVISPSNEELAHMYTSAQIVVSPSFHEGLCVPVIEGYAAGCRAIGTTAGNLPFVIIPPDPVVPPGEPSALAAALEAMVDDLVTDDVAYHERCRTLVDSFSPRSASAMLQRALLSVGERTAR